MASVEVAVVSIVVAVVAVPVIVPPKTVIPPEVTLIPFLAVIKPTESTFVTSSYVKTPPTFKLPVTLATSSR